MNKKLLASISLHALALDVITTCVSAETQAPASTPNVFASTSSPVEFSYITVYNDGGTYTIDDNSHGEEVFVLSGGTNLLIKSGGVISAPSESEWPAIRLSVGSTLNSTGGTITGSTGKGGGVAIQLNNGQSTSETAGYAEFYEGVKVVGGDATDGTGGDAFVVNGFGTKAIIHGGEFIGGIGTLSDGYSLKVLNSATVHLHGGAFEGDMMVEGNGMILLHGCFLMKNGTQVIGTFGDDTELDVNIKRDGGGSIDFMSVPEQECDTAPSVAPTSFPTLSPKPTVVQTNNEGRMIASPVVIVFINLVSLLQQLIMY